MNNNKKHIVKGFDNKLHIYDLKPNTIITSVNRYNRIKEIKEDTKGEDAFIMINQEVDRLLLWGNIQTEYQRLEALVLSYIENVNRYEMPYSGLIVYNDNFRNTTNRKYIMDTIRNILDEKQLEWGYFYSPAEDTFVINGDTLRVVNLDTIEKYNNEIHGCFYSFIGMHNATDWKDDTIYKNLLTWNRYENYGIIHEEVPYPIFRVNATPLGFGKSWVRNEFVKDKEGNEREIGQIENIKVNEEHSYNIGHIFCFNNNITFTYKNNTLGE